GLDDRVVPPEQAEAIVAAAARQGVPHAYIAFEGEQHGFRRAENIVTWLESELAFYGQVMGFTPRGDLPVLDLSPRPAWPPPRRGRATRGRRRPGPRRRRRSRCSRRGAGARGRPARPARG